MSLNDCLKPYRGKTILITGASGFIGTALTQAFNDFDARLVLMSNKIPPHPSHRPEGKHITWIFGDVGQRKVWESALCDFNVDYVFHLATLEHKHGSSHSSFNDLDTNARSVLHLLETCREKSPSTRIVFASSSNLVGLPSKLPINEDTPDDPLTLYAIHKLMSEKYLQFFAENFNIQSVTLRLTNVYGPLPHSNHNLGARVILNRLTQNAVHGKILYLFKNQACVRDYVYIDDVIKAFLLAGIVEDIPRKHYFLIGSGEPHTIREAIELIANQVKVLTKNQPEIKIDDNVLIERVEMRDLFADTTRFRTATGWSASVSLAEGVNKTINFYLKEIHWAQSQKHR